MALGFNVVDRGAAGDLFFRVVDVTLDNAYAGGGWAITPQQCGFGANGVIFGVTPLNDIGYMIGYNRTTGKLLVRDSSAAANTPAAEISAAATGINGTVARLLIWGKGQG